MVKLVSHRLRAALVTGAGVAACVGAVPAAAQAQEGNSVIGPPQLRDFQLEPRQRIVTQPRPTPTPAEPAEATPAPPERPQTRPFTPAPGPQGNRPAPSVTRTTPAPAPTPSSGQAAPRPAPSPQSTAGQPAVEAPTATAPPTDQSTASAPPAEPVLLPDPAPPAAPGGGTLPDGPPAWLFFLAFATLGLLGYGYWLRRRNVERRALAAPAPPLAPATPPEPRAPRPAPQPRPWLELDIVPERANVDVEETVIEFALIVRNSGGTEARNVRLQARMFASTPQQDKEIGDYFKADEAAYKTIAIPPVPAGEEVRIQGSVDMKQDRISALRVDGKLLFIPLIAVNARYDWGTNRSGHSARSWVIGREGQGQQAGEKMGPFRMDLGARVYRTIGRRPHALSRRV